MDLRGGYVKRHLADHLHTSDPDLKDLFEVYIYALFFETLLPTKPIVLITGEKGSGKSFAGRAIKKTFFGAQADVDIGVAADEGSARAAVTRNYFICMDNVDGMVDYITSLRARDELAFATVESYRKILKHHVQPHIGANAFAAVQFSKLEEIANRHQGSKKTFNNVVSAIRGAWRYGYKDLSRQRDPALGLECVRIPKREQPKPDPFDIDGAEILIKAIAADWGEAQGNYDEFRFFTGLRPSEEIALTWSDLDLSSGELL